MPQESYNLSNLSEDKYKGVIFTYFVGAVWIIAAINAIQNLYLSFTIEGIIGQEYASYNPTNFTFLVVLGLIWWGHRWYPQAMRHLFVVMLIASSIFTFDLADVNELFVVLTLPIIMAAFLIQPVLSFAYYGLIVVTYALRLQTEGISILNEATVPFVSLISLIVFAVVSWLIARSLEKALAESRALNRELDQRVRDRTRELAEALTREHATAVRNTTILRSIADGVLVFDANGRVIVTNPAANRLAKKDLQPLNLGQVLDTVDDRARDILEPWLAGKKPADQNNVKFEWYERTVSANVAPVVLPTETGQHLNIGQVMVLRDFTREAQLEKMKDIFLGTVSHELRTPMSAIKGYVGVLLQTEKDNLSSESYDYLQTIDTSIKQLLQLANELIDVSRMETGEMELYREWVDLGGIIEHAAKIVRQEFASRNLTLEVRFEDNLPKLYLDRSRMLQVLLNLLSNAYKYTMQGGATVEVTQTDTCVHIAVADTGVGMKETDRTNLFNRFFRASDRVVQKAGGTGLGLSITKGLIELHGGALTFESEYGIGTTFRVALPKHKVDQDAELSLQESDEARQPV
jgi:signal transduction histidine kinase